MTRTIEQTIYTYSELSEEAKQKAIDDYIEGDDMPFLSDAMYDRVRQLLKENDIKYNPDELKPYFSLSYSQGDGAMFVGHFEWKNSLITVEHSGHYYHEYSRVWDAEDKDTGEPVTEKIASEWTELYTKICIALRDYGYVYIEEEQKPVNVIENFEANNYEFYENGDVYYEF